MQDRKTPFKHNNSTLHRKIVIALLAFATCLNVAANEVIDSLFSVLDGVVVQRSSFIEAKQAELAELRRRADTTPDRTERFHLLVNLFDGYMTFNTDSAYSILEERRRLVSELKDTVLSLNVTINRAAFMDALGQYKESEELLKSVDTTLLPDWLKAYYFHVNRNLYGHLEEFSLYNNEKEIYASLVDSFRDSILSYNHPESLTYAIVLADKNNSRGKHAEAVRILTDYMANHDVNIHEKAIIDWTLYCSLRKLGENEEALEHLLKSSISDLTSGVREYVSLRELAMEMFRSDEVERAYTYITTALEDAKSCNARNRILEIDNLYPLINSIYIDKIEHQKRTLEKTVITIALLGVTLLILLYIVVWQMKKVSRARHKLHDSLLTVSELNEELKESNNKLIEANVNISEISELKETYIAHYMTQSSRNLDLLNRYRTHLGKLLKGQKYEELNRALKSSKIIDDELKEFYTDFDDTFLSLFPNFVKDFNALLQQGEEITPKKPRTLTPELRIYALIRLGINDSDMIARFLRYSVSTIYNYRTKMRNKSKGNRNKFEEEVMKIGHNR